MSPIVVKLLNDYVILEQQMGSQGKQLESPHQTIYFRRLIIQ